MTTENTEQKPSTKLKIFTNDVTTGKAVYKGRAYKNPKGEGFTAFIDGVRYYAVLDNSSTEETTDGEGA